MLNVKVKNGRVYEFAKLGEYHMYVRIRSNQLLI